MLSNSSGLAAVWAKNPRGDSAGGCASPLHSRVLGGGLRHILPCLGYCQCTKHLALLWSQAVRDISCRHFHCASGKHTPSKQQQQTRGVSSYTPHRGGTPFSEMPQGTMRREAWAHSWWIGVFRAGSEMQWPGCKWGSPGPAELETNGYNGGGFLCPSSVSVMAAVGDRLQCCVDFNKTVCGLLASLLYISNPSCKQCGTDNKLKALAGLHCLIESVPKALWGLPLTPVGFGSDFKCMGLP